MKNITLALLAMVLAGCLVLLLFLATHQNALVKVHEKISSYSGGESIVEAKDKSSQSQEQDKEHNDKHHGIIEASMKKDENETPHNAKNFVPIAQNSTHKLENNAVGKANLPKFSKALAIAQKKVNTDNNSNNKYNDYGIDSTCQGVYYYIFTFENDKQPGTYYRVTVNTHNEAEIFDKSYKVTDNPQKNEPCISPQESEVIAEKYAVDNLGPNVSLKQVKEAKEGMYYTYTDSKTQNECKVVITKAGDVIQQPALK
ncbi:hypothetical protein BUZ14_04755 [Staphylococcus gallinarum]|uniref:Lipoprotein n=2 Tax=Staphylococcus gallinarum TaxID=1293 RepID=A0A3A0VTZ9_STAGA|nr:hypothetical protein [Staphylococcus gallinarum]RIP36179.1 hypothetical protein BUZ14_04755 [Staphylococcus gallinarum]